MILHAANEDGLAFEIGQNAAEVSVQFIAHRFVAEERPSVFGGADRVHQNFGEGFWHGEMMRDVESRFNPFRVDGIVGLRSQGSLCRATLG